MTKTEKQVEFEAGLKWATEWHCKHGLDTGELRWATREWALRHDTSMGWWKIQEHPKFKAFLEGVEVSRKMLL